METVRQVQKFKGTHVVGFDIAADEAGFPVDNHNKAFWFANANSIRCSAHAGEAKGAGSIWETLQNFHPSRIGHGVRSPEDTALLSFQKANGIHLEVCPTSNVQTSVFGNIENHTADQIFNAGVSISLNTDTRTISNVTLADEYRLMERVFRWDKEHFKKCNPEAVAHSFAPDDIRQKIRQKIEAAY